MHVLTSLQTLDRGGPGGPDGFGRDGRGFGHHMGVVGPVVCGLLLVAAVVLALLAWRRNWFGSSDRRRRQFDEWHRLAHAGPVPTGPAVAPWPTVAAPTVAAPAPASAPEPPIVSSTGPVQVPPIVDATTTDAAGADPLAPGAD